MLPAYIEEYFRPANLTEALELASNYNDGDAIFLAGGQSAMQAIKTRILRPKCVIDLQDIDELRFQNIAKNYTELGALTRYVEIAQKPDFPPALLALKDACAHVGDRQVRNRGTIGGSICWNYLASCVPTVFLALNGKANLQTSSITRQIKAEDFFLGPLETVREEDELLTKITFPTPKRTASAYQKWGLVKDALPVVGIAVSITINKKGKCEELKLGLAGLPAGGQLASQTDAFIGWAGQAELLEGVIGEIASGAEVHSDLSASGEYRQELIKKIGKAVCVLAYQRAVATL